MGYIAHNTVGTCVGELLPRGRVSVALRCHCPPDLGNGSRSSRPTLTSRHVTRNDPTACLVAGTLSAERGRAEVAFEHLKRAAELDGGLLAEVATLWARALDRPDPAWELVSDSMAQLTRVEQLTKESGGHSGLRAAVSNPMEGLLEQECQATGAPARKFAWLAPRDCDNGPMDEATEMYRRALVTESGNVSGCFSWAQLSVENGRMQEAMRVPEIGVHGRPRSCEAWSLLRKLLAQMDSQKEF